MSNISKNFLDSGNADLFGPDKTATGVDLTIGGQYGWSPALGLIEDGKNVMSWINNQAYIKQNVVALLMQAPKAFDFMPNGKKLKSILKALIEQHSQTIEGIDLTITNNFEEQELQGGVKQAEFKNATMAEIKPAYTWIEKFNKIIYKFWYMYSKFLLGEKGTSIPMVTTLSTWKDAPYSADMKSFTVLYFEPDVTRKHVVDAVLGANHMPDTSGTNTLSKDTSGGQGALVSQTITFTCLPIVDNREVNKLATQYLRDMQTNYEDPSKLPSFLKEVKSDVKAA